MEAKTSWSGSSDSSSRSEEIYVFVYITRFRNTTLAVHVSVICAECELR
jgi:hypothetical protein